MDWLRVKDWMRFQHYKVRNPPWIKLYRSLLSDYDFLALSDTEKCHLILIWLEAANHDGKVANDSPYLRRRLGLHSNPNLKLFINNGWLVESASINSEQSAMLEKNKNREEKIREERPSDLDRGKQRSAVELARNLASRHLKYPN